MSRRLSALLIITIILQLLAKANAAIDLIKLVERVQPAVATIITYEKGKNLYPKGRVSS